MIFVYTVILELAEYHLLAKTEFANLTDKKAAPIIGEAVIRAANKLLSDEGFHYRDYGVEIELIFKTYKRNGRRR